MNTPRAPHARSMRRPLLKDFLVMECGEVLKTALFATYLENLIAEWATGMRSGQGQLPDVSGRDFASWLDHVWEDWTEEPEAPVQKILEGAVSHWCGGRSF